MEKTGIITNIQKHCDGKLYFVCDVADGRYMECVVKYDKDKDRFVLLVNDFEEASFWKGKPKMKQCVSKYLLDIIVILCAFGIVVHVILNSMK